MARFEYIATDKNGKEFSGVLEGNNSQEITSRLKREGLEVTSVRLISERPLSLPGIRKKVSLDDLAIFNGQLASVVKTELPLVPSLREIAKDIRSGRFKSVIEDIAKGVESGQSLYESLSRHPDVFSQFYLKVIDAGEKTGNLSAVLNELIRYSLRMFSFRRRLRDALVYPAMLVVVGLAVTTFFLTVVVPVFKEMYGDFETHLPAFTQFVFQISDILTNHPVQIIGGLAVLIFLIWLVSAVTLRTPGGGVTLARIKMKIPVTGAIVRHISIIHLSRTLGTLLSSGVPIVEALELSGRSTPNRAVDDAVKGVIRSVEQGESLSSSLQNTGFFPHSMVWMLSVGEKRGKLDGYLIHNAEIYQERLEGNLRRIEMLIGPIAILILGVFVFFAVLSLFLPLIQFGMLVSQ